MAPAEQIFAGVVDVCLLDLIGVLRIDKIGLEDRREAAHGLRLLLFVQYSSSSVNGGGGPRRMTPVA